MEGVRGIIPARAGFTGDGVSVVGQTGDHPRSRGVYSKSNSPPGRTPGSSPLARGLPGYGPAWERELRIIPARAGFTRIACGPRRRAPDHPRSRGVYTSIDAEIVARIGSSPLARGLLRSRSRRLSACRIIPARAGFTEAQAICLTTMTDHPRSRGVYPRIRSGRILSQGSSPLARGLLPGGVPGGRWTRIIPARAGFTACPSS